MPKNLGNIPTFSHHLAVSGENGIAGGSNNKLAWIHYE